LGSLEGHTSRVNGLSFSPDGQLLASVSSDNRVKIWRAGTGYALSTFNLNNVAWAVAFSSDGLLLATGLETAPSRS